MTQLRSVLLAALLAAGCSHGAPPSTPSATPAAPSALAVLGSGPGISMAHVVLGPGESLTLPAGRCQDMSVLVEKGTVETSHDEGKSLAAGRAARFSTTTTVHADPEHGAALFATATVSSFAGVESANWNDAPENDACPQPAMAQRRSDPEHSGPFMHAGDRLAVMIYLDGAGTERPVPSLGTLEGDKTLNVPEHTHDSSAEVLWIQDGSGTMRVGDETRPIRPGTFVYVPPNTIHGFEPDGSRPLFAYQVYMPSGPEQRFRTSSP